MNNKKLFRRRKVALATNISLCATSYRIANLKPLNNLNNRAMNKAIPVQKLRTFFRISNAVFDCANVVQLAFYGNIFPSKMKHLHKIALEEIEKENPDLLKINKLLTEMESLCINPKPNFPKGG